MITDPYFANSQNPISTPRALATEMTTTFADAPMIVKFPPKSAPSVSAHYRGLVPSEASTDGICLTAWTMVAV